MQYPIKIAIALLPVFLFFAFYFRHFIFSRSILWQSKALFYGLLASSIALLIQLSFPTGLPIPLKAFIQAALVEELVRFVIIYIRVKRSSETFTVLEGTFDGILIGLGFSFAENLHYSTGFDGFVILLRCVSSVPIHAFCGGIVAFFLSYRYHLDSGTLERRAWNRIRRRNQSMAAAALLIPTIYHGFYDYCLFLGGDWNYVLPLLLMAGFFYLEYLIARARIVLSRNVLELLSVDAEDMDILQRQIEYEKWMAETIRSSEPPPRLLHNHWGRFSTTVAIVLFAFSAAALYLLSGSGVLALGFEPGVSFQAQLSLLVLLPLSIGLILIASEKINYLFVRQHMLRLPRVAVLTIVERRRNSFEVWESDVITLDVLAQGLFASAVKHLNVGDHVHLVFFEAEGAVSRDAVVRWVNRDDIQLPQGTILRYTDGATLGFLWYRMRYESGKLIGRIRHGFTGR